MEGPDLPDRGVLSCLSTKAAQNAAVGQIGPFHSPSCSIAFFAKDVSTTSSYLGVLPSLILPTLVIKSAVKLTRSGLRPLFASQMHSLTMKSKLSDRIFSGYPVCFTRIGMILALSVYMIRVASMLAETTACTISGLSLMVFSFADKKV